MEATKSTTNNTIKKGGYSLCVVFVVVILVRFVCRVGFMLALVVGAGCAVAFGAARVRWLVVCGGGLSAAASCRFSLVASCRSGSVSARLSVLLSALCLLLRSLFRLFRPVGFGGGLARVLGGCAVGRLVLAVVGLLLPAFVGVGSCVLLLLLRLCAFRALSGLCLLPLCLVLVGLSFRFGRLFPLRPFRLARLCRALPPLARWRALSRPPLRKLKNIQKEVLK